VRIDIAIAGGGIFTYDVSLDNPFSKLGTTDEFGDAVFFGIPVGGHTFYAVQLPYGNSGQKHQYIHTGFN